MACANVNKSAPKYAEQQSCGHNVEVCKAASVISYPVVSVCFAGDVDAPPRWHSNALCTCQGEVELEATTKQSLNYVEFTHIALNMWDWYSFKHATLSERGLMEWHYNKFRQGNRDSQVIAQCAKMVPALPGCILALQCKSPSGRYS